MGADTAEGHPQLRVRREHVKELPEDGGDCRAGPSGGRGGHRAFQNGRARSASAVWGQRVSGWDGEKEQDMERCRRQREER